MFLSLCSCNRRGTTFPAESDTVKRRVVTPYHGGLRFRLHEQLIVDIDGGSHRLFPH
jgi:hypothetical protein